MIQFNDKLEVTDHDLSQMANRWAKLLPNEDIGIRTAFAHGFKAALSEVKKLNKSDVSGNESTSPNLIDKGTMKMALDTLIENGSNNRVTEIVIEIDKLSGELKKFIPVNNCVSGWCLPKFEATQFDLLDPKIKKIIEDTQKALAGAVEQANRSIVKSTCR